MQIHICELCGYEYNPKTGDVENGVAENTDFELVSERTNFPYEAMYDGFYFAKMIKKL